MTLAHNRQWHPEWQHMAVQLGRDTGNWGHTIGITHLYFYFHKFLADVSEVSCSNTSSLWWQFSHEVSWGGVSFPNLCHDTDSMGWFRAVTLTSLFHGTPSWSALDWSPFHHINVSKHPCFPITVSTRRLSPNIILKKQKDLWLQVRRVNSSTWGTESIFAGNSFCNSWFHKSLRLPPKLFSYVWMARMLLLCCGIPFFFF